MKLEMKSLIKKRHLRFCLILVGFCVALLFAEGFVRVFYPYSRDHVVPGGLFEIDDYLGWKFTEAQIGGHHTYLLSKSGDTIPIYCLSWVFALVFYVLVTGL